MEDKRLDNPTHQNIQFVAATKQVLDIYKRPYDEFHPVVCMDESPKQMIKETRVPVPMKLGQEANLMMPFSMAMETVLPIRRFSKSGSFNRSFLNLESEFGFIMPSQCHSQKYLKDMSKRERSTISNPHLKHHIWF